MPKKIRELTAALRAAGFRLDRQKGSHRQYVHERFRGVVTLSGGDGDDAKRYQENQVAEAIAKASKPD